MTQVTMPATIRKPRKQPIERSATFEAISPGRGLLTITVDRTTTAYGLVDIGSDIGGRGFELTKLDSDDVGTVYHTLIGNDIDTRCDCISGLHRGTCRHVAALRGLIDAGQLPALCPAGCGHYAGEHGHPCPPCQAEILADLDAIAYTGRRNKIDAA